MGEQPKLRAAFVAVLLVVLGLALWAAYRLAAGIENHAYSPNAIPPDYAAVTANHSYKLSYPGGVDALTDQGLDPRVLSCTWSAPAGAKAKLDVEGYRPDVTSRNEVATFEGPTTGRIQVQCDGLGAMFLDDADNVASDPSGWFLVASTIVLTSGVALTMRVLRTASGRGTQQQVASSPPSPLGEDEDDDVQRLVRLVRDRSAEPD